MKITEKYNLNFNLTKESLIAVIEAVIDKYNENRSLIRRYRRDPDVLIIVEENEKLEQFLKSIQKNLAKYGLKYKDLGKFDGIKIIPRGKAEERPELVQKWDFPGAVDNIFKRGGNE